MGGGDTAHVVFGRLSAVQNHKSGAGIKKVHRHDGTRH
jgi:hypothetical protein